VDTWFTSDFHIGHLNIIKYCGRPFKDAQEMNEALIARHNALVKPGDLVINVGDFSMSEKFVEPTLKRLNGKQILICGNHDRCYRFHSKAEHWRAKYLEWGFAEVLHTYEVEIGGQMVRVEHMPYSEDSKHGERYASYRPKDDGRFLLHGHVHSKPETRLRERQLDVGVDGNDYKPLHLDEVAVIIASQLHASRL
jgi:calcineurin-like phosphoesterase family protein